MEPEPLTQDEVDRALAHELPQWSQDGDSLVRSVEAPSFLEGIELVRRVAQVAEELDHHPDIDIRWRTVTFRLSTHSAGAITMRDTRLAADIDRLAD
ncbi:MAG: 4a-hydroxytetrahydrobiopterin dehydratase [Nocardioidaceae bacterium]